MANQSPPRGNGRTPHSSFDPATGGFSRRLRAQIATDNPRYAAYERATRVLRGLAADAQRRGSMEEARVWRAILRSAVASRDMHLLSRALKDGRL